MRTTLDVMLQMMISKVVCLYKAMFDTNKTVIDMFSCVVINHMTFQVNK